MDSVYELFVLTGCPYCAKVLTFMKDRGIELPVRNISEDAEARQTLEAVGGKVQCPCLFIDGKPLYESDDIIAYLDAHVA